MSRVYDGAFPVSYGQFYLLPNNSYGPELEDSFRGQSNGICGTAVKEAAFLITGLHTGNIYLTIDLLGTAPSVEAVWHDVVEVPLIVGDGGLWLVSWGGEEELNLGLAPGSYRIRYSALNMGDAEELDIEATEEVEKYSVVIWPSSDNCETIVKQKSESAVYWHRFASELDIQDIELEKTEEAIRPSKKKAPKYVYIRSENTYSKVVVSVQKNAIVGEWIELTATRENSPWKKIEFTRIEKDSNYIVSQPDEFEEQVAANLSWNVEPSGCCRFNTPTKEDALSDPRARSVSFQKPGKYRISGYSAFPIPSESNISEIIVTES